MLALARGLMTLPKILMLDEPSLGLAPIVINEIFGVIHKINQNGVTIFLIEQDVLRSLKMAKRAYVLENGRVVLQGESDVLLQDEEIKKAYLGL